MGVHLQPRAAAHRVAVRPKWAGTSVTEGPGIVLFPWSATHFTPAPPPLSPVGTAGSVSLRRAEGLEVP